MVHSAARKGPDGQGRDGLGPPPRARPGRSGPFAHECVKELSRREVARGARREQEIDAKSAM